MSKVSKPPDEITFRDLSIHFWTGQSFLISGAGRDKRYGYRHGVMTALGDLELSEWRSLLTDLIERHNEQELLQQLCIFSKEQCAWLRNDKEAMDYALGLHANRVFDNPKWVDYVPFNQRFRPEVLDRVDLVWIETKCCGHRELFARKKYEKLMRREDPTVYCDRCQKRTTIILVDSNSKNADAEE